MSARKGYLLPSPNYPTTMSCSESPAANSFLVDSLISSGRGEAGGGGGGAGGGAGGGGGSYYAHGGVYLPPAADLPYGLQSCGLFPALGGKRNEAAASPGSGGGGGGGGGLGPGAQGYAPAPLDLWLDAPRSCRMEPPDGPPPPPPPPPQPPPAATACAFAQNIKEESSYCLYDSTDKCPKASAGADLAPFPRGPPPDGCALGSSGGVPVPGYFRLSQAYGTAKGYGGGGGGGAQQLGAGPFPAQPPGRGFDPQPALASGSSEDARKERALDSPPPPTLPCAGGSGGSQGDEEAHASSSAAEELSPAPSESSKASPDKDSLGKPGRAPGLQADSPHEGRGRARAELESVGGAAPPALAPAAAGSLTL